MSAGDLLERLDRELSRGEDAVLHPLLEELGLFEDPPEGVDGAVLARLGSAETPEGWSGTAARLDPDRPVPSHLDAAILARARSVASERREDREGREDREDREGREDREDRELERGRSAERAAAAVPLLDWARWFAAIKEHAFLIGTAVACAAALGSALSLEHAAVQGRHLVARSAPPEARWAVVDTPLVPAAHPELAFSRVAGTATVSERSIAEALAGPAAIGRLRGDGTLEVVRAEPSPSSAIEVIRIEGAVSEAELRSLIDRALPRLAACVLDPRRVSAEVALGARGPERVTVQGSLDAAAARCFSERSREIAWPRRPARVHLELELAP
ncbi:MAG: hypothetical protein IT384_11880 [Deltaproteobacteria bacterium]|nr:hypothetical protein [Deltaproteobacteria bacterium]